MSGNKDQKTKLAKKVCEKNWGGVRGEKSVRKKPLAKSSEIILGKVVGKKGKKSSKKVKISSKKFQKKVKKSFNFFLKKSSKKVKKVQKKFKKS